MQEGLCQFMNRAVAILYPCLFHRFQLFFRMGCEGIYPKQKGEKGVKESLPVLLCHGREKLLQTHIQRIKSFRVRFLKIHQAG